MPAHLVKLALIEAVKFYADVTRVIRRKKREPDQRLSLGVFQLHRAGDAIR